MPRQRKPSSKQECRARLREIYDHLTSLAPAVRKSTRFAPRRLYNELDGLIGKLAEVQQTLITRNRIRPKPPKGEVRPDLWWPRYWKMVREMEQKGIDPKSPAAADYLQPLAAEIFN